MIRVCLLLVFAVLIAQPARAMSALEPEEQQWARLRAYCDGGDVVATPSQATGDIRAALERYPGAFAFRVCSNIKDETRTYLRAMLKPADQVCRFIEVEVVRDAEAKHYMGANYDGLNPPDGWKVGGPTGAEIRRDQFMAMQKPDGSCPGFTEFVRAPRMTPGTFASIYKLFKSFSLEHLDAVPTKNEGVKSAIAFGILKPGKSDIKLISCDCKDEGRGYVVLINDLAFYLDLGPKGWLITGWERPMYP